jgi:hypothetical protein
MFVYQEPCVHDHLLLVQNSSDSYLYNCIKLRSSVGLEDAKSDASRVETESEHCDLVCRDELS